MATYTRGIIVYKGDYGSPESNLSKGTFKDVLDSAKLDTLATALIAFSDAVVAAKHFNSVTEVTTTPPGADANVDLKAMIVLKDTGDGSVIKFLIPAPKASLYEATEQGDRVTDANMATITAAVNAATGKTFTPLYGKIIQKP